MDGVKDETQARITALEELSAHQALTIDEMSAEIASQWKIIDKMDRLLERLTQRFSALEEASLEAPAITKPPHY
jgi:SlyX protein